LIGQEAMLYSAPGWLALDLPFDRFAARPYKPFEQLRLIQLALWFSGAGRGCALCHREEEGMRGRRLSYYEYAGANASQAICSDTILGQLARAYPEDGFVTFVCRQI